MNDDELKMDDLVCAEGDLQGPVVRRPISA